jgi:aspartyl-tRNA(Asn)/glutamyl-tRNA(Gln) amidotransferase subunit A
MGVTDPADLGVVEAAALLATRQLSSTELVSACLSRVEARDGTHSHDGDPGSINAWARVYAEDAGRAAAMADDRLSAWGVARHGPAPPLCGVPVGLKDLYAVAGRPLTASSRLLELTPDLDCDVWVRLQKAGMVLLGHLHTHEFAAGGTTDQVGNPWGLDRSSGGSSGGSAAALAAHMVPAATGTDTGGSLRIPSALCATSTIKPTRGTVSLAGVVPLGPTLDHAGPMARSLVDCAALLTAMAGPDAGDATTAWATGAAVAPFSRGQNHPLSGTRLAVSPRLDRSAIEPDVADAFKAVVALVAELGGEIVEPPSPPVPLDVNDDFFLVLLTEVLDYHRRFDGVRDLYRPSIREMIEQSEALAVSGEAYVAAQARRRQTTAGWAQWLAAHHLDALLEPTVPVVAPLRGGGYDHFGTDAALISLTYYWNWTGWPVVSLPAGVGSRSGLPVGVSVIGPQGADASLLAIGVALQVHLGVPEPARASCP